LAKDKTPRFLVRTGLVGSAGANGSCGSAIVTEPTSIEEDDSKEKGFVAPKEDAKEKCFVVSEEVEHQRYENRGKLDERHSGEADKTKTSRAKRRQRN
jgi:hypothetical protein